MYFLYVCSLSIYTGTMELANSNCDFPKDGNDQGRLKYVRTII
jgi:hypothetical protein